MESKEDEYRQLFLSEALENHEALNKLFVDLEKDHKNKRVITEIFRIVHTLKGNALGMGYDKIADLTHVMEDVFGAIKEDEVSLDTELVDSLFRANDKLGGLINALNTNEKVSYLGIKTKLAIFLKNARDHKTPQADDQGSVAEDSTSFSDMPAPSRADKTEDTAITFADVVQIPVKKMDDLLNMVGELVVERDRLMAHFESHRSGTTAFEQLKRISANLHYGIMNARMVQMGFLFNKFHRVLRDAAMAEHKEVKLRLKGTEVEIDRNILKIISDSLVHLVRNAVAHGIETAEARKQAKKPLSATVSLEANLEKDRVILSVSDDGRGIDVPRIRAKIIEKKMVTAEAAQQLCDDEVIRYIFEAGFSSAEKVTEISGRGVGMDVVKRSVEGIGGQVMIESAVGEGTTFHLVLPSSLALKGALLFEVSEQAYAIPLTYIASVNYFKKEQIHRISKSLVVHHQEQNVALVFLNALLRADSRETDTFGQLGEDLTQRAEGEEISVIMARHSGRCLGLVVDKLLRQKEIIEKKLPPPIHTTQWVSGSTILGSGEVCPVIDVGDIMDSFFKSTIKE